MPSSAVIFVEPGKFGGWSYWGLNSGPYTCNASAVTFDHTSISRVMALFHSIIFFISSGSWELPRVFLHRDSTYSEMFIFTHRKSPPFIPPPTKNPDFSWYLSQNILLRVKDNISSLPDFNLVGLPLPVFALGKPHTTWKAEFIDQGLSLRKEA